MVFGMVVYLDLTKKLNGIVTLPTFNSALLNTVWEKVLLTIYSQEESYVASFQTFLNHMKR
jgi:hypothetical protein